MVRTNAHSVMLYSSSSFGREPTNADGTVKEIFAGHFVRRYRERRELEMWWMRWSLMNDLKIFEYEIPWNIAWKIAGCKLLESRFAQLAMAHCVKRASTSLCRGTPRYTCGTVGKYLLKLTQGHN